MSGIGTSANIQCKPTPELWEGQTAVVYIGVHYLRDDQGNLITDDQGNPIVISH